MKLGIKSLCAIGALLLCSNDVLAQIFRWEKFDNDGGVSVVIKGPVTESDLKALSNPFVIVRSLTFDGNNLKEFTQEMMDVFKKLTGVISFSIQNNKFSELPEWINECFPRLKRIYFWGNPIEKSPNFLLNNGYLEIISGNAPFSNQSRGGINKDRQLIIDSYKNNIQDDESKLDSMLPEGWDVKRKLQALDGYLRVWKSCKFHSEEKKKPLESEKKQLEAEKVQLAERKTQLEAKIVQLKEAERRAKKVGASKRVKKELNKRVKKANKEIEKITKRGAGITEKSEGITVEINSKNGDIESISEKIQKIAEEIMPIDLEINQYDSQIEQIEKEKDEINSLQKEIESYRNTLAKLEKAQKISLEIAERENRR